MIRLRVRTFAAVLVAVVLTGCSTVEGPVDSPTVAEEVPVSTPPIVSDRFLLESTDQQIVGALQVITAREEDTFVDVARAYNLGFDELVEANPGVDPWIPGAGTRIVLPTRFILPDVPRDGIVINLANKRLFYFLEPDEDGARAVVTFPIGIGRSGSQTPTGETTVTSKARDPVWYVPASIRREYAAEGTPLPPMVMPGPDNPLGSHVLLLGMPSYLIHGTNKPAGVGMRVSHGCVRLFPENIEFLFATVPVGITVRIVNQPQLLAWERGRLYLEAHPPLSDDQQDWSVAFPEMLEKVLADEPNGSASVDPEILNTILGEQLGIPLPLLLGESDAAMVVANAIQVNNLVVVPVYEQEVLAQDLNPQNDSM
jgi:L,D-transpeptidase ErfK/SrfK